MQSSQYQIRPFQKTTFGTNNNPLFASSTTATTTATGTTTTENDESYAQVSFSHIHLFVDHLEDLTIYKQLEDRLNKLEIAISKNIDEKVKDDDDDKLNKEDEMMVLGMDVTNGRSTWNAILKEEETLADGGEEEKEAPLPEDMEFIPQGRDVVKQLISGLGFRVTGIRYPTVSTNVNTRSVLLTTKDLDGVQFVISSLDDEGSEDDEADGNGNSEFCQDDYSHFDAENIHEFYDSHSDRQGIAVLAFEVESSSVSIESLHQRYQKLHPKLISDIYKDGVKTYNSDNGGEVSKVLEVYAFYKGQSDEEADLGTKLRFVQVENKKESDTDKDPQKGTLKPPCILPGLEAVPAEFDNTCMAAYCDHWVSNVISRTGFIDTLEDVLGFQPKVDFNAGVVAAGEAQIESTVTGNDSLFSTLNKDDALQDQSQVFLPINNALSEVGHVHGFLQEIGQGIQHIASRVDDLAKFVQRGNDYRQITGEGFTFLRIPRSYYGVLTAKQLMNCGIEVGEATLSESCALAILDACEKSQIVSSEGAVNLDMPTYTFLDHITTTIDGSARGEFEANKNDVLECILRSRYANLYNLLGDNVNVETYLALVRNQILVDVQGGDILFQIFTSNILQRNPGDEAPFFEFIQRVCSDCVDSDGQCVPIKPGCGGFGIRNFLTLFLSIEVGKAMLEVSYAKSIGDDAQQNLAQKRVDLFTEQLNESNPILTEIADAMTAEGNAIELKRRAEMKKDEEAVAEYDRDVLTARTSKIESNEKLMKCSAKYNDLMKSLRESS